MSFWFYLGMALVFLVLIFIDRRPWSIHGKLWASVLVLAVFLTVALFLPSRRADTRRSAHVEELIAEKRFEEAIEYVKQEERSCSVTEKERAYIDVFTAALPGCYAGEQSGSAATIYLYIPESVSYEMEVALNRQGGSYTLKDLKQGCCMYVFPSEETLTAEEIREKALAEPDCRAAYGYLRLSEHKDDPCVTVFSVQQRDGSAEAILSERFSFNLKEGSLDSAAVHLTKVSDKA